MRTSLLTLALFALLVIGCTGGGSGDWTPPDQADVPAEYTDCSGGEACTIIELGCCDRCNGGGAISVVDSRAADARGDLGELCEANAACTEIGCEPIFAVCDDGRCIVEDDDPAADGDGGS